MARSEFDIAITDYQIPPDLIRHNIKYGPELNHRLDWVRTANRTPTGNALCILAHGGSNQANNKSDFCYGRSSASEGYQWTNYFNGAEIFGTIAPYVDVLCLEYPCVELGVPANNPPGVEETWQGTYPGSVVHSWTNYMQDVIESFQLAWQWAYRHADEYGWDRNLFIHVGHSFGSLQGMIANLQESRRFHPSLSGEWDAHHEAHVPLMVNFSGEINLDPRYMFHSITRQFFGLIGGSNAFVREQMHRMLLTPDADGLYEENATPNDLCKKFSPIHLIQSASKWRTKFRMLSYYKKWEDTIEQENNIPLEGYTSFPPWKAGGHEWRQGQDWHNATLVADRQRGDGKRMDKTTILDYNDFPGDDIGTQKRVAQQSMLQPTYQLIVDRKNGNW